jgi:hypothetical protein
MAPRRSRSRRRATAVGVLALALVAVALLVGVVQAAHRDPGYRRSVDESFAAAASSLVTSSNATGAELARMLGDPGVLGRVLLESRLQHLAQVTSADSAWSTSLTPPPPDANAASRLIDTLRLRADATRSIRATLEGLLGLTPINPVGTASAEPAAARPVGVPGAEGLLRYAGEQLVLADRIYRGLPALFVATTGSSMPLSQWTSPRTGRLMPATLKADASSIAADPRLRATVNLVIAAVQTQPLLLPLGTGYPVPPTSTLTVAISVVNRGSAPTPVIAIIRVRPVGRSAGHFDAGRATGAVAAGGAVALQFPPMDVVPGGHFLVSVDVVRPHRQVGVAGLSWVRTVVVGSQPR